MDGGDDDALFSPSVPIVFILKPSKRLSSAQISSTSILVNRMARRPEGNRGKCAGGAI
jgi:hypothetical protein